LTVAHIISLPHQTTWHPFGFVYCTPNGLRYPQVSGRGQGLGAGKTRNQKNARKWRRTHLSSGRVKGWRLGRKALVSIPCHIEPDMRFSLIRLSDNLLPEAFKV
jgi:hypothetical protein